MKNKLSVVLSVAAGLILACSPLIAHHSDSRLDLEHPITITGTVIEYQFVNPHQVIRMTVKDANGKATEWSVTGGSPNQQRAGGWTSNMIHPGEQLTVTGAQNKDGQPIMLHCRITRANGEDLPSDGKQIGILNNMLAQKGNMTEADRVTLTAYVTKVCATHPVPSCPGYKGGGGGGGEGGY